MIPMNSKSLLHFIFGRMESLAAGKISVQDAQAQANLAKQANNLLMYELKRAETLLRLDGTAIKLREIEGKPFDDTIQ